MVAPAYTTPVFAINNLQDAFELINGGLTAYQNATAPATQDAETPSQRPSKKQKSHQPDVDIYETASSVIVQTSLPGVDKADINVEYDAESNRIILTGEYKAFQVDEHKTIRRERPVGRFERIVGLNKQSILADKISATHENGVLTLTIPKNSEAETKRKINIL